MKSKDNSITENLLTNENIPKRENASSYTNFNRETFGPPVEVKKLPENAPQFKKYRPDSQEIIMEDSLNKTKENIENVNRKISINVKDPEVKHFI